MPDFRHSAQRLCGAAATLLGWRPDDFWGSTPAELATCLAQPDGAAEPPDKQTVDELRARFPD